MRTENQFEKKAGLFRDIRIDSHDAKRLTFAAGCEVTNWTAREVLHQTSAQAKLVSDENFTFIAMKKFSHYRLAREMSVIILLVSVGNELEAGKREPTVVEPNRETNSRLSRVDE